MSDSILSVVAAANPAVAAGLQRLCLRARAYAYAPGPVGPSPRPAALQVVDGRARPVAGAEAAIDTAARATAGHATAPGAGARRPARSVGIWILVALCGGGVAALLQMVKSADPSAGMPRLPLQTEPITISVWAIAIALGGLAAILLCARLLARGIRPLQTIGQLDAESATPLGEIEKLAARSVQRLRSAYQIQLALSVAVAVGVGAAFLWSIVMVSMHEMEYATALGSGGLGATVLAARWQPFDRVVRARFLAEQADVLATGLRIRMATIEQIADPRARQKAEWNAVKEYTEMADAQATEHEQPEQPPLRPLPGQPLKAA